MADVTFCRFKEKRYSVFFVIKGFVLPFQCRNLFDSFFLKRKPQVDAIPEISNFTNPPAKPGVYPGLIKMALKSGYITVK